MIDLIKTLMLALSIFIIGRFVVSFLTGSDFMVKRRLRSIKDRYDQAEDETKSFSERLIKPIYDGIFNYFSRLTPDNILDEYDDLLVGAGLRDKYTPGQMVTNQILLVVTAGLLAYTLMSSFSEEINYLYLIIIVILSGYLPFLILRSKSEKRKKGIERNLPNMLDMIYISVEAGLSFDAAMTITARRMDGALSDEILKAMSDINNGRVREDALYSIAERTKVDDVRTFISTIIQSEKLGSNISNVLRIQSDVIRDKRKQRAEEEINKMPIKMLLPLVFLLLPALFVVIMGPSVISVMQSAL